MCYIFYWIYAVETGEKLWHTDFQSEHSGKRICMCIYDIWINVVIFHADVLSVVNIAEASTNACVSLLFY